MVIDCVIVKRWQWTTVAGLMSLVMFSVLGACASDARKALHRRPRTKCAAMQIGRSRSSSKRSKSEPPSRRCHGSGADTLAIRFG